MELLEDVGQEIQMLSKQLFVQWMHQMIFKLHYQIM
jgi:hypothetical protein